MIIHPPQSARTGQDTGITERCATTLEAGRVTRYHAVPTVAAQNIGHHSWGVAIIAIYICPNIHRDLLFECLMHDSAELFTGDVPFTVKRDNADIKERFDAMEDTARVFELLLTPIKLDDHDKAVLKMADTLEGFVWCCKTEVRGPVMARWTDAFRRGLKKFSTVITAGEYNRASDLFKYYGGAL